MTVEAATALASGYTAIGAGLAVGLAGVGTGIGEMGIGAAAVGATAEDRGMFGLALLFHRSSGNRRYLRSRYRTAP